MIEDSTKKFVREDLLYYLQLTRGPVRLFAHKKNQYHLYSAIYALGLRPSP